MYLYFSISSNTNVFLSFKLKPLLSIFFLFTTIAINLYILIWRVFLQPVSFSMLTNMRSTTNGILYLLTLEVGLGGFNVGLEQRNGLLPTVWHSSLKMVRRRAITILIRHGWNGSSALVPQRYYLNGNLEDISLTMDFTCTRSH